VHCVGRVWNFKMLKVSLNLRVDGKWCCDSLMLLCGSLHNSFGTMVVDPQRDWVLTCGRVKKLFSCPKCQHTVSESATSLLGTRLYLWFQGDYSHQVLRFMSGVYPLLLHIRLFCCAFFEQTI
jgi:hypothetical protein